MRSRNVITQMHRTLPHLWITVGEQDLGVVIFRPTDWIWMVYHCTNTNCAFLWASPFISEKVPFYWMLLVILKQTSFSLFDSSTTINHHGSSAPTNLDVSQSIWAPPNDVVPQVQWIVDLGVPFQETTGVYPWAYHGISEQNVIRISQGHLTIQSTSMPSVSNPYQLQESTREINVKSPWFSSIRHEITIN